MKRRTMTICWGLFGLFVLIGVGSYVGNNYAWSRVTELSEQVIPTLPKSQKSHYTAWQVYESPSDVPEDVRTLSLWMDLIVYFDRLKWIGAIGAVLMMLITLFLRSRPPA